MNVINIFDKFSFVKILIPYVILSKVINIGYNNYLSKLYIIKNKTLVRWKLILNDKSFAILAIIKYDIYTAIF